MLQLYEKIEELCKEKGVNITTMCRETAIPRASLSDYKMGRIKSLSSDKIAKIADYFNVTIDYLMGSTDQKEKPLVNNDPELTEYLEELKNRPEMRMLFKVTKKATKASVERSVRIIEALLKDEEESR